MADAVEEIDRQSNCEEIKIGARCPEEGSSLGEAKKDAQNGKQLNHRNSQGTRSIGISSAQNDHPANERESEQRPDVG